MDIINAPHKFENIFAGREDGYGYFNGINTNGKKDCRSVEGVKINIEKHLNGILTQGQSPINRARGGVRYIVIDVDQKYEWKTITNAIW